MNDETNGEVAAALRFDDSDTAMQAARNRVAG